MLQLLIPLLFLPCMFAHLCADKKSCCSADFTSPLCSANNCSCEIGCTVHGTCCKDYTDFCLRSPPEPCIYNEWSAWSSCSTSKECDVGFKTRRRDILQTGNFNAHVPCEYSALEETTQCGDIQCYRYQMERISDVNQFARDNFRYSTTVFKYQNGNCDQYIPFETRICIMCTDESRCGDDAVKNGDTLEIYSPTCVGKWKKQSDALYRQKCYHLLRFADVFAFVEK